MGTGASRQQVPGCWPRTCYRSGPDSRSRPWSTSASPTRSTWTGTRSCRTSGPRSTGPGGPPTVPPRRSARATAAPGWRGRHPNDRLRRDDRPRRHRRPRPAAVRQVRL